MNRIPSAQLPTWSRPVLAGAVVAAVALTGCTDNAPAEGAAGAVEVTITDDGCQVAAAEAPAGAVSFSVTNSGTVANEFEILAEDKLRIVAEKENIGPGATVDLTTALTEGTYFTACKPNMVGDLVGVTQFTVQPGADVAPSEDDAELRERAVANYTGYIKDQTGALLTGTEEFAAAYAAGDEEKARELYPLVRMHYERIEPTAEAFGIEEPGDLDGALDARVQDLALDAGTEPSDPAVLADWHGWHRMEADLFTDPGSPYDVPDPAARQAEADLLVTNTQTLYDLVFGEQAGPDGASFEVSLADITGGAGALMEEVALGKIVGEEETFSHTDLYDFQANLEGARVAYGNVAEIVQAKDPELDAEINERMGAIDDLLAAQRQGTVEEPVYPDYSEVAAVQDGAGAAPDAGSYTDTQREFSDAVNAASESLSQVATTVLS